MAAGLDVVEGQALEIGDREADGNSPDFDKWADENEDGADEALEESTETA